MNEPHNYEHIYSAPCTAIEDSDSGDTLGGVMNLVARIAFVVGLFALVAAVFIWAQGE